MRKEGLKLNYRAGAFVGVRATVLDFVNEANEAKVLRKVVDNRFTHAWCQFNSVRPSER
jgi:hypothetical protein